MYCPCYVPDMIVLYLSTRNFRSINDTYRLVIPTSTVYAAEIRFGVADSRVWNKRKSINLNKTCCVFSIFV